jgi:starch synthase
VHVLHNGIDTEEYQPDRGTDVLAAQGIDPDRPSVVFVGRITRQKGVPYLVEAALEIDPAAQIVLCAGAPDTPEIAEEVRLGVERLEAERGGVIWIEEMLPKADVIQLLSHATVFACPSIYEPLGIVNLEAMACETAVVASRVGGIPEVVVDGETGLLVDYDPADPSGLERGLAEAVNRLAAEPALAERMGRAGRRRAVQEFAWVAVAEQTVGLYQSLVRGPR